MSTPQLRIGLINWENPHLRENLKIAFIEALGKMLRNHYDCIEYDELLDGLIAIRAYERKRDEEG